MKNSSIDNVEEEYLLKQIDSLDNKLYNNLKINLMTKEFLSKNFLVKKLKDITSKLNVYQYRLDKEYGYNSNVYSFITNDIIKLDYKYKISVYGLFKNIKNQKSSKKRIKLIKEIIDIYNELYKGIDLYDYESKEDINKVARFFHNSLVSERKIYSKNLTITKKEKKEKETIEYEPIKTTKDFKEIPNNYDFYNSDIKDIFKYYVDILKNCKIDENLILYTNILLKKLKDDDDREKYFICLYSIKDLLKYRKLYNPTEEEKNIIKVCSKNIKEFLSIFDVKKFVEEKKEEKDYKFDILSILLRDYNNYELICKLLEEKKDFLNAKNNNSSIVVYILSLYLRNYEMIIKDHKYIYNIDYLKEVYKLFLSNKEFILSVEDKNILDNMLNDFINNIDSLDINTNKKRHVKSDVDSLYPDKFIEENNHKEVRLEDYNSNIFDMYFYDMKHGSLKPNEVDLTSEDTFILNDPYTCYSYVEGKGKKVLKIHTADISSVVEERTALNNSIYNDLLDGNEINDKVLSYLKFKKDELSSALTYEITMDNDRNIKGFKVYKSRIKVDGELLDYKTDEEKYKNLRRLESDYVRKYGDFNLRGLDRFEYVLKHLMQKEFIKMARNNNLPIIAYKVIEKPAVSAEIKSEFMNTLKEVSKSECNNLNNIFNSSIEDDFYSNKVRLNEEYDLLLSGEPNYLYLLNQRMIKYLVLNEGVFNPFYGSNLKRQINDEYSSIMGLLNEKLNHKEEIDFDYKKRRRFKSYILKKENYDEENEE